MPALAVQFYDVVVALHVLSAVIAFGVTFSYPVVLPWLRRHYPEAIPGIHATQARVGGRLITPFATLLLLTGIYLATDGKWWSAVWVTVPLIILVILLGLGGAFFSPRERQLSEIARRDLAAGDGFSEEYARLDRTVAVVGALASLSIVVAVFFMVLKPFA